MSRRFAFLLISVFAAGIVHAQAPSADGEEPEATEGASDEGSSEGTPNDAPAFSPPRVLEAPPADPGDRETRPDAVVMEITLDESGALTEAVPTAPLDADLEHAVREALRRWRFAPAMRDGSPFAARVRVSVPFAPPLLGAIGTETTRETPSAETPAESVSAESVSAESVSAEALPDETSPESSSGGFGATGETELEALRTQERGAGDIQVQRDVLEAAPRQDGADLLRTAPGVYLNRSEGDGVAHQIMLRGFDAEHGQDLEIRVGHLPINLPSHLHGQGYADLGFLIPEVVSSLRVLEGVSDPQQGDFAIAGSININLGVERRGLLARSSYGSFNTFRQLLLWAPKEARDDTFAAVQFRRSDGFGDNRNSLGASSMMQYGFGNGPWRFRLTGIAHGIRARTAGVLRRDDIDAGRVGFYRSYDHPTADNQNALSTRAIIGFSGEHRAANGANAEVGLWLSHDVFRLQANYTGFVERSEFNSDWVGRGDLIEQQNRTTSLGLHARFRTKPYKPASWFRSTIEVGLATRLDLIEQAQFLIQAPQNQTWDERDDADIRGTDIGVYGDLAVDLTDFVSLRVGARADILVYEIDDRLGNRIPDFRADSFIVGFRRSAFGVAAGPRASAVVRPAPWLSFLASYGEGFRSPQARTLDDGETAPFSKVRGGDLGAQITVEEQLELRASGFYTRLSDDVAFEPREGRLERIGATRRLGATVHMTLRPVPWLVAAGSLTYVDAELLEPPPATADDPQPPFEEGQNLPYVPPWVLRLDVGAQGALGRIGSEDLRGRIGVGFNHLSSRPLPFGESAAPVSLLDAAASIGWGPVELGVQAFNLADARYAAFAFNFASDWNTGGGARSRLPARHIAAGAPRTVMFTLELHL